MLLLQSRSLVTTPAAYKFWTPPLYRPSPFPSSLTKHPDHIPNREHLSELLHLSHTQSLQCLRTSTSLHSKMATYDYQIAKTVLTDVEKDRILCIYLNRRPDGSVSRRVSHYTLRLLTAIDRLGSSCRRFRKRLCSQLEGLAHQRLQEGREGWW